MRIDLGRFTGVEAFRKRIWSKRVILNVIGDARRMRLANKYLKYSADISL